MPDKEHAFVYVGGWDRDKKPPRDSIHLFRYEPETATFVAMKSMCPGIVIGEFAVDESRGILYCADQDTTHEGYHQGGGGVVYAFSIDPESGELTEINQQPSYGTLPAYCTLDASGDFLLVAHYANRTPITKTVQDASGAYRIKLDYDAANLVLFPIAEDGSIGEPCDIFSATGGGGPLPVQTSPHLHCVTRSPSGNVFAVCDKGSDRVLTFGLDHRARRLRHLFTYETARGILPRYTAFHPTRPFLFLNCERDGIVQSLRYDEAGTLELISNANALPDELRHEESEQSDLRIDQQGRFLYTLIRGVDAVSVFAIDEEHGLIERVQTVAIEGRTPQGCCISPDGKLLLVAAMMSDDVSVLAIGKDGLLSPTPTKLPLPQRARPAAFAFVPSLL